LWAKLKEVRRHRSLKGWQRVSGYELYGVFKVQFEMGSEISRDSSPSVRIETLQLSE
jgi:hypothetical protein